jgi:uncharacterized protein (DUF2384 family)
MTALRRRLSATKPAKGKSSRKVVAKVAKHKKSTSKASAKGPKRAPLSKAVKPGIAGLARQARLFAHASRALGTEVEARAFMRTPHPELGGLSPLGAARTDPGVRRVEEILHALEYGLAL